MMQKMMPVMMREMIPERKSYFQDSVHTHIHLEVMDYAFQFFINLEATKHKQTCIDNHAIILLIRKEKRWIFFENIRYFTLSLLSE